jgi:hypothetical protein
MSGIYESGEVTELVGIHAIYLTKFVERGLYGIEPSVRPGERWKRRRLFSGEDVQGVALVWWLFESGLRSQVIRNVLNKICGGRLRSKANNAAKKLIHEDTWMLTIKRRPRTAQEKDETDSLKVCLLDETQALNTVKNTNAASVLVLPVGPLFSNLKTAMEMRDSQPKGEPDGSLQA